MIILGFIVDSDAPFFHLSTRFYQKRYWRNNCFTLNWNNIRIHNRFTIFLYLLSLVYLTFDDTTVRFYENSKLKCTFSVRYLSSGSVQGFFVLDWGPRTWTKDLDQGPGPRILESWHRPGPGILVKFKDPWCGLVIWWECEFDYFYYLESVIM